jgi:predicted secreted protein
MPERQRRIALVAHCHLDINTKVHGLADRPAGRVELVSQLLADGIGIVQLPCPEVTYLGMSRWGMTREQYDTPAYRRHCRALIEPVVDTVAALVADGCEVVGVWGVDGSPSCGVDRTCAGYEGGEIESLIASGQVPHARAVKGRGIFFEELQGLLSEAGITPVFHGIDEAAP